MAREMNFPKSLGPFGMSIAISGSVWRTAKNLQFQQSNNIISNCSFWNAWHLLIWVSMYYWFKREKSCVCTLAQNVELRRSLILNIPQRDHSWVQRLHLFVPRLLKLTVRWSGDIELGWDWVHSSKIQLYLRCQYLTSIPVNNKQENCFINNP